MGQRLNLEIRQKGKPLANAYYHWSAYTASAYGTFLEAYKYLSKHMDEKDKRLLAIRALEATGAGLSTWKDDDNDLGRLRNIRKYLNVEFADCVDRNEGIISCFPDTMEQTQDWAEGTIIVDIDTLLIRFDVWCYYDEIEDVKEYFEDAEDRIEEFDCKSTELDFGALKDIITAMCKEDKIIKLNDGYFSEIA